MSTKIFEDLKGDLFKIAQAMTEEEKDHRFKAWAKFIEKVDPKGKDGYAFSGEWVNGGAVEVELKPTLFLVMFRHGSNKYNTGEYAVIKMTAAGDLEPTGIMTDDSTGGWALRIRDLVIAELAEMDDTVPLGPGLTAREHQVLMLGYNQALLDYAQFPIVEQEAADLAREHVQAIVDRLREELGI
jgi:hypothetical protein